NIKKNSKFYFPYLLTCVLTSGMFYIMCMIAVSEGLNSMMGAEAVSFILMFGTIVIGIFSVIFLFYTNSFLMKRRKKEIGLYNILGMEKRHISMILLYETLITGVGTIAAGLITGILFSKLIFLLLYKIIQFKVPLGFYISGFSMAVTCLLFFGIFFLTLLFNLWQIRLTNPIDLLKGSSVGEREPKSKLVIALVGAITLGAGYYIAITTESP
ncbi:MAG TPA: cell division protein FtsX, partial [Clostridiales bacterium]|nr:cell division protein FtsX [Clostridiales bacterium]